MPPARPAREGGQTRVDEPGRPVDVGGNCLVHLREGAHAKVVSWAGR